MSQYFTNGGGGGGGGPINTLTGNSGGAVPPTAGNINTVGDAIGITVAGNPGTSTLTASLTGIVPTDFPTDAGTAIPSLNSLSIVGAGPITTSAALNVVTINTDGTVATQYNANVGSAVPLLGVLQVLGAGAISTTAAANVVTISTTGGGLPWTEVTLATGMAGNNGYIANSGAILVFTLPIAASVGDIIEVSGKGVGGWIILQNAGQTIYYGNTPTTTGGAGSLSSTHQRDAVRMVCVTANNDFNVLSSQGNLNAA